MKNLSALHQNESAFSAQKLFDGEEGTATSFQLHKEGEIKAHISKIPALLLCIDGEVIYEEENGKRFTLKAGDYVNIVPFVEHWIHASMHSQLVLLK